ncbi:hypothetical protein DUI87_04585 [Hirundo rustica rustica]|uniref:Uncharacterized protein n=1 Tax=Hirundo rustica rustica TaxID=333673 RepID=A0A3M0KZF8_HIRRU|nr:hypothetical protein DUI87_04585 [Hirundo rustica rustica]
MSYTLKFCQVRPLRAIVMMRLTISSGNKTFDHGWASSCPIGICDILNSAVSFADNLELDLASECIILQADLVFIWTHLIAFKQELKFSPYLTIWMTEVKPWTNYTIKQNIVISTIIHQSPKKFRVKDLCSRINLRFITIEDTGLHIGLLNISKGCDDHVIYAILGVETNVAAKDKTLKHSIILPQAQNQIPQEPKHNIQRWNLGNTADKEREYHASLLSTTDLSTASLGLCLLAGTSTGQVLVAFGGEEGSKFITFERCPKKPH